ncbi:glycosyltransferase family 2 protein [Stenotrophomonas sp. C3(2023)]|uniref:glycosyltransferase family 2 protein n=1 Tax=Stenotrophomonas sp. C3(2023) TaxID=3080277 RepID=UPI00293C16F5|nr:glycosyltransferase family 2 protein [Stenotrophomonas sp. C3(2023)]MDV3469863.1 glycosyltransferase family 2 protein [Stenotrophomonas sp. C3(2023)]
MNSVDLSALTVVCVTYNSREVLPDLARTLADYPAVVIVDNASGDDTVARARELLPQAQVIARTDNAGFGAANNIGVAQVRTPFALLLNPDCAITPANVATLLACMQAHPQAAIVAPQGWRTETLPQKSCRPAFNQPQPRGPYQVPTSVVEAGWVHGSCLLVRRSAFEQVGGFDTTFFLYYEDDDLCLRMQQAGFSCLLEPAARSRHWGGGSSTPSARTTFIKQFHYARSRQIAMRRYVGPGPARAHRLKLMLASVPAMLAYTLLLRRYDVSKWAGWGLAGFCATLHLDSLAQRIR